MWQCFILYECGLLPLSFSAFPKSPIHSAELLCCSWNMNINLKLLCGNSISKSFIYLLLFLIVTLQSSFFLAKMFLEPVSRRDCICTFLTFLMHGFSAAVCFHQVTTNLSRFFKSFSDIQLPVTVM